MLAKIFKSRGLYIALMIVSTLVLAGALIFVLNAPKDINSMPHFPMDMPENFTRPDGDFPGNSLPQLYTRSSLPVAIAAISFVMDAFCVFMLVRLGRLRRKQRHEETSAQASDAPGDLQDEPVRKKSKGGFFLLLIAILALAVGLMPKESEEDSSAQVEEKLIEATAEAGSITKTLISGGSISENTAQAVKLAGDIKVESYLVENGDYVEQGQPIAKVDKDSVILAISKLSQTMAELDGEINASLNDVTENAIYSPARGRVKSIYTKLGEDVQDTMREHSALMRISLDGLMAARIEAKDGMYAGMAVTVRLPDGALLPGSVESVLDGSATVTISDETAVYGELIEIFDVQGQLLGTAELYIHKEVKICGITGTVQRINVVENMLIDTDIALVVLTNTFNRGQHELLTAQRREMEEEITELFKAYNTGEIYAPCTGRIVMVNEDIIAKPLAFRGDALLTLLSSDTAAMESKAVSVTAVDAGLISVEYVENNNTVNEDVDLGSCPIFKYVNGSYQPCTAMDITVGDSLLLSYYVSTTGAIPSIDHAVIFPAQPGEDEDNPGGQGTGGMGFSGGAFGGGGGRGYSGGSSGMSFSASAGGAGENEQNAYSIPQTVLAQITPFDTAEIVITVDENDISAYIVGQTLELSFDALGGQSFEGRVSKIDPNGSNDGGSTKYSVSITLNRTADMLTGMNASVRLVTEERKADVIIPLAAVYEENGDVFVYTGYDAEEDLLKDPVPIRTGLSDGVNVELVSGLSQGDRFYYRYASNIKYIFQQ